jgi:predicted nucleotidyltransferase
MKLKAGRQKDLADVVELLKRGRIEIGVVDLYLQERAPQQVARWERTKEIAAREE